MLRVTLNEIGFVEELTLLLQVLKVAAPQLNVWLQVQSPSQLARSQVSRSSCIFRVRSTSTIVPETWVAVEGTPALLTHVALTKYRSSKRRGRQG